MIGSMKSWLFEMIKIGRFEQGWMKKIIVVVWRLGMEG